MPVVNDTAGEGRFRRQGYRRRSGVVVNDTSCESHMLLIRGNPPPFCRDHAEQFV